MGQHKRKLLSETLSTLSVELENDGRITGIKGSCKGIEGFKKQIKLKLLQGLTNGN